MDGLVSNVTSFARPFLCLYCEHFAGTLIEPDRVDNTNPWYCTAFPDGIPAEIMGNEFDHRNPHPNDGGVRFLLGDGWAPDDPDNVRFRDG